MLVEVTLEPERQTTGADEAAGVAEVLERQLTGEMACMRCGYALTGLSITGACPECGLPVRATLLSIVDPRADEIAPIRGAGFTALGLVVWTGGGLLAALGAWGLHLARFLGSGGGGAMGVWVLPWVVLGGACVSWIGAVLFARSNPGVTTPQRVRTIAGIVCYLPLLALLWLILGHDRTFASWSVLDLLDDSLRAFWRLGLAASLSGIIFGLRPAAVRLAMRSRLVREGRVDRQSLYTLLWVVLLGAIGDAMTWLGAGGDLARTAAVGLIGLGSLLLTIGLVQVTRDTVRLIPVILGRPMGLSDVLGPGRS